MGLLDFGFVLKSKDSNNKVYIIGHQWRGTICCVHTNTSESCCWSQWRQLTIPWCSVTRNCAALHSVSSSIESSWWIMLFVCLHFSFSQVSKSKVSSRAHLTSRSGRRFMVKSSVSFVFLKLSKVQSQEILRTIPMSTDCLFLFSLRIFFNHGDLSNAQFTKTMYHCSNGDFCFDAIFLWSKKS